MTNQAGTILDGPSFGPMAGGEPTGLVVLCHGVGSDGFDLIDLAPVWGRAVPHVLFRSPHGPEAYAEAPMGRQWFPLWDRSPAMLAQGVKVASAALGAFIDAELARLGLPADAYALMGFSQGAMMALHTGLTHHTSPRAILAYSGRLLDDEVLISKPKPRILLVHGAEDQMLPVESSREAAQKIKAAGGDVQLVICPGLGHGIDEPGLRAGFHLLKQVFAE